VQSLLGTAGKASGVPVAHMAMGREVQLVLQQPTIRHPRAAKNATGARVFTSRDDLKAAEQLLSLTWAGKHHAGESKMLKKYNQIKLQRVLVFIMDQYLHGDKVLALKFGPVLHSLHRYFHVSKMGSMKISPENEKCTLVLPWIGKGMDQLRVAAFFKQRMHSVIQRCCGLLLTTQ